MNPSWKLTFALACALVLVNSRSGFAETWKFGLTSNDQPIEAVVVSGPSA